MVNYILQADNFISTGRSTACETWTRRVFPAKAGWKRREFADNWNPVR